MKGLIRAELGKLLANKGFFALLIGCSAVYSWLTFIYYLWNQTLAWERIVQFPYSAGSVFIGLALIFALTPSFAQEHQSGTAPLIFSTRKGVLPLTWAKLVAALLLTSIVVSGYWFLNLAVNLGFAGTGGWNQPMQVLEGYAHSPYPLAVWQYVLVQWTTNWLGACVFALFILFLSARIRSYLTSFFISGTVFLLPFLIRNSSEMSLTWLIKYGSMIDLMRVENLFNRLRFVVVGEGELSLPLVVFYLYTVLFAVGCLVGILRTMSKQEAREQD